MRTHLKSGLGCASADAQGSEHATGPVTEGQQAEGDIGVIITNERDRRALRWLRERFTDSQIADAVSRLAGARKPYLSNVAKVLGVSVPDDVTVSSRETALAHLEQIKNIMRGA